MTEQAQNESVSAEDRTAIQQVLEMERYWRDRREWDRQLATYTEDCVIAAGWFQGSAKDFVARSKEKSKAPGRRSGFHYFIPSSVRMCGDRALAESSCQVMLQYVVDGIELDLTGATRSFSRLQRTARGWKIASLHGIYQKDWIAPALPWQTVPIKPEEIEGLRTSYRMHIWMNNKLGIPTSQDMLGDDRPEQLQAFYREAEAWLALG